MRKISKVLALLILTCISVAVLMPAGFIRTSAKAVSVSTEAALVSAVKQGGEIQLKSDITLTDMLVIPSGVNASIDLNGKILSRTLSSCMVHGSVIRVEPNATLTINDGSGNNAGTICGGASWYGGGICNNGTLYFDGGTISGNRAEHRSYGTGGGIFSDGLNGSRATLYLRGGIIKNNTAQNGAGVFNGPTGSLEISENEVVKKKGSISTTYYYNVTVTANSASVNGGGIYNSGAMKISDSAEIYANDNCDIYIAKGRPMSVTGELKNKNIISVMAAEDTNPVIAKAFAEYNNKKPTEVFRSADSSSVLLYSVENNGDLILANNGNTVIQVYKEGKITKVEETDSDDFPSVWNKAVGYSEDNACKAGLTTDDSVVEIILGRDFSYDSALNVNPYRNIILDLNGHCIRRAFKKKKNGYMIKVGDYAKLTVSDSNPNSDGYKEHKGGVIADGNGDDCGGGIVLQKFSQLYMTGGTIYNCRTDLHGGAVYSGSDYATVYMKDCMIDSCSTKDSGDDCHGAGIYIKNAKSVTLESVTIKNCNSEDKGGALYLREKPRDVVLKTCTFTDNFANDGGGAIFIDDLKSDTEFSFEAEDCIFKKNKANDDGGAVYVNDDDEYKTRNPVIFRDCTFSENESTKYGGAIEVNDNGVVLFGGTITKNKASGKGGGIYVEGEYDISVAGRLVIKDNDGKDNYDNLCLEENSSHKAYVYDAGLYEGSEIWVSTSNNKTDIPGPKNVSEYQSGYFHPETGTFIFNKTEEKTATMVTASLFGDGSGKALFILCAVAVLITGAALIIRKKKGVAVTDDDDEE